MADCYDTWVHTRSIHAIHMSICEACSRLQFKQTLSEQGSVFSWSTLFTGPLLHITCMQDALQLAHKYPSIYLLPLLLFSVLVAAGSVGIFLGARIQVLFACLFVCVCCEVLWCVMCVWRGMRVSGHVNACSACCTCLHAGVHQMVGQPGA